MVILEDCLLQVADMYASRVEAEGGKSLARVATIAVNNGSFFDLLRQGQTCFVRNLRRATEYFDQPDNWPGCHIPPEAEILLRTLGAQPRRSGKNADRQARAGEA